MKSKQEILQEILKHIELLKKLGETQHIAPREFMDRAVWAFAEESNHEE